MMMIGITASGLATELGVTRGRVSQYVAAGQLDGCFVGAGRLRRFDLHKCASALGKRLDAGQMMGNGAGTRKSLEEISSGSPRAAYPVGSKPLPPTDPDRYELARIQKAEEEARRLRRQNSEAEGQYVLASEVELQITKMLALELAQFESVLRDAARAVADKLGVDFKTARQLMVETWRDSRRSRATILEDKAENAAMNETELLEDI